MRARLFALAAALLTVLPSLAFAADFFYNDVTGKSQWEEPEQPVAYEDEKGQKYWYDSTKDESSWEESSPQALIEPHLARNYASRTHVFHDVPTRAEARAVRLDQFPGPWQEVQSEEHGQPYFFNKDTETTTWEKPEELGWRRVTKDEL